MYVLRMTNNTGGDITLASAGGIIVSDGDHLHFPADRCVWQTDYNAADGQYEISEARFFALDTTGNAVTLSGANRVVELGIIGKSGRFVALSG